MGKSMVHGKLKESQPNTPRNIAIRSSTHGIAMTCDALDNPNQKFYRSMPKFKDNASSTLSPCSSGRSMATLDSNDRRSFTKTPNSKGNKTINSHHSPMKKCMESPSEATSADSTSLTTPRRRTTPKTSKTSPRDSGESRRRKLYKDEENDQKLNENEDDLCVEGVGFFMLKMARSLHLAGENPHKARYYALKAAEFFENSTEADATLELVTSLHLLAATCCKLGQYDEAIPILKRSLAIFNFGVKSEHALGMFAGYMQLGDTYTLLGQYENALKSYDAGLEIQKQILGEMDPQVAKTCIYVAESHLQAMQFNEAEELCAYALTIHRENNSIGTLQEASDRRLMALILSGKGDYVEALEHLLLARASLHANGKEEQVAFVDCGIGDSCVALGRYEEAVATYQKALIVFKLVNGESHTTVASVYVNLADLYLKSGRFMDAKSHCEKALVIYGQQGDKHSTDEIATGLSEIAGLFVTMGENKQALNLLQRALEIMENIPGQQSAVGGIEGQIGVLLYLIGKHEEAYMIFKKAVSKLSLGSQKKTWLLGILLNQMGLACLGLNAIWDAAENFEEAKSIMEEVCGPHHPDTLDINSNLAGSYDAMGRLDDAIVLLEYILEVKEDKLGTVHPEVEDDRQRLMELLKETGRSRARKASTLQDLIFLPSNKHASKIKGNSTSVPK